MGDVLLGMSTGVNPKLDPLSKSISEWAPSSSSSSSIEIPDGDRPRSPPRTGDSILFIWKYFVVPLVCTRLGLCFDEGDMPSVNDGLGGPRAPVMEPRRLVDTLVTSENRMEARFEDLLNLTEQTRGDKKCQLTSV